MPQVSHSKQENVWLLSNHDSHVCVVVEDVVNCTLLGGIPTSVQGPPANKHRTYKHITEGTGPDWTSPWRKETRPWQWTLDLEFHIYVIVLCLKEIRTTVVNACTYIMTVNTAQPETMPLSIQKPRWCLPSCVPFYHWEESSSNWTCAHTQNSSPESTAHQMPYEPMKDIELHSLPRTHTNQLTSLTGYLPTHGLGNALPEGTVHIRLV